MKEKQKIQEAIALAEYAKSKKISYFKWVKAFWTARGEPLEFTKHRYLQAIYEDQYPEIVWKKSAQAGLTERMITEALWIPDQHRENSLYLFPTSGTMSDLVQERIDDPINQNHYLSRVSGRAKKIMGKQADKMGLKRMSRGFGYFRGSNNPTQITSVSADAVFVDELDRMMQENVPYFKKRMSHSKRFWIRWASTPTIPNFGIDVKFNESDQHYCYIKCPHCGEQQTLTFWDNIEGELLVCKKCRKKIIPWQCEMEWLSMNKGARVRGYAINQLLSPRLDIKEMVEASKKTSEWEVMQFYNQDLGLAYEPKGAKITEDDMQACIRDYTIPTKSRQAFMGVDVGRVLHLIIQDEGRILHIGEYKDFEDIYVLMDVYNIKIAVIDALPETRKSQEFATKFPGRVNLCYYTGLNEVKEGNWFKVEPQKVNTNRTLSLDKSTNEIKTQGIQMPKNINDYSDFKNHMKNLIRVISEDDKGNKKAEYMKTGEDHYRHAYNYSNLAKNIFGDTPMLDVFSM